MILIKLLLKSYKILVMPYNVQKSNEFLFSIVSYNIVCCFKILNIENNIRDENKLIVIPLFLMVKCYLGFETFLGHNCV